MRIGEIALFRRQSGITWEAGAIGALTLLSASLAVYAVKEHFSAAAARRDLKSALDGYEEARRSLDATAIFRHDHRKHISVVRKMLSDGQTERALSYLNALSDTTEQLSEPVHTGNYMIDLILNSRLAAARNHGVRINVKAVQVPDTLALSDDALSALLCNAVDNAVAAARADGGKNGWISIDLHRKGQMLYIGISNSCSSIRKKTKRKGYGRLIMRNIVEHCHGVMETERRDRSYRLSLLLPVND